MELKKSDKANLEKQKTTFNLIGLTLVMALVLAAFEWGSEEIAVQKIEFQEDVLIEDDIENTKHEEEKPQEQPAPPALADIMLVVDDNVKLTTDLSLFENEADDRTIVSPMEYVDAGEEEALEEDIPFTAVEEPASFKYNGRDGVDAFRMWIGDNMKYPEVATENGIQGRVIVQFTVNTEGRVVNVKVLRGVDPALDKEAIRVIESSPRWTPGKQRNKPVRILYTLPVIFQLQ
ncbi:MAG: energy transducer TonB [Prevotellaceae bacterium]|jgi:protein TonB|nr:energy transducer TonB [Prevotellaceae bacterium]